MTAWRFGSTTGSRLPAVALVATATAATSATAKGSAEPGRIGRRDIRRLRGIADDDRFARIQFAGNYFCCCSIRDSQNHTPRFRFLLRVQYINDAGPLSCTFRRHHLDLFGWIPLLPRCEGWRCRFGPLLHPSSPHLSTAFRLCLLPL